LKATLPPTHSNFGVIELVASQLALAEGRPAEARAELGHAVALFDGASDKTPLRIRALERLAEVEQRLADPAAALRDASLALDQAREVSKGFASTAWLGSALLTLGSVELAQGDHRAAGPTLRAALGQLQDTVGEDAPATREARRLIAIS
jgi:tetratricopeptide (TPR) repeat protein